MARRVHRLTAKGVTALCEPGYHADGGGLYLQVTAGGAKSWILRFTRDGKAREMGLGSAAVVSLAVARNRAQMARAQLINGHDPIEARRDARKAERLAAAAAMTFEECAEAYIAAHEASWSNAKHAAQWKSTLKSYAYPRLGAMSVQAIDTDAVFGVLNPIWGAKTETASRLRGRIERVLDWASVRGHRAGDNPARWRGHLDHLLPQRSTVQKVVHHAALPYAQLNAFMLALVKQAGIAARALAFQILTTARIGEVIGATWDEVDLKARIWTVPGERMKAKREHRVPLSTQAVAILTGLKAVRQSQFIFPGLRAGKPLSNMAMRQLLSRMEQTEITVHGFRSSFRDWAAETTAHSRDAAEMALAHTVGDKVEAAYRRGDLFEKRRALMRDWGDFCCAGIGLDALGRATGDVSV